MKKISRKLFLVSLLLCVLTLCGCHKKEDYSFNDRPDTTNVGEGTYFNDKVLSYTFKNNNTTISFGIKSDSLTDAIYLNPTFVGAKDQYLGLIIQETRIPVMSSSSTIANLDGMLETYPKDKVFYISNRTHDTLKKAQFADQNDYGLKWVNNGSDGYLTEGTTLDIYLVSLYQKITDGGLLGVCRLTITYNSDKNGYELTSLENADVSATGEVSKETRDRLVDAAAAYIQSDKQGPNIHLFDTEYWDTSKSIARVVKPINGPLFSPLLGDEQQLMTSNDFLNKDVFAVNLLWAGYGYFTVYVAPEKQIVDGLDSIMTSEESLDDMEMVAFGYDPLQPFSVSTLVVPEEYWSWAGTTNTDYSQPNSFDFIEGAEIEYD